MSDQNDEKVPMDLLLSVPSEVCRQKLLPFLTIHDVSKLDCACANRAFRDQLLKVISGSAVGNGRLTWVDSPVTQWLSSRNICLNDISFCYKLTDNDCSLLHNVVFATTSMDLTMVGAVTDGLTELLSSCHRLRSLTIGGRKLSDNAAAKVALHCRELRELSAEGLTNSQLCIILKDRPNFETLCLQRCSDLTDDTLRTICQSCPGLLNLDLISCSLLSNDGVAAAVQYCKGLRDLNLAHCCLLSDVAITAVAANCPDLRSLNLFDTRNMTDAGIMQIAKCCPNLESLVVSGHGSQHITDASFVAVAQHCKNIRTLNIMWCPSITDVSVVAATTHCTKLQYFDLTGCGGISKKVFDFVADTYEQDEL